MMHRLESKKILFIWIPTLNIPSQGNKSKIEYESMENVFKKVIFIRMLRILIQNNYNLKLAL